MASGKSKGKSGTSGEAQGRPSPPQPQSNDQSIVDGSAKEVSRLSQAEVLGQAVWLLSQSPKHKYLYLSDLEWALVPPLSLRQFKLYRKEGTTVPVAIALWARLSSEVEKRFLETRRLRPQEWNSGDHFHIVDVIAPFGGDKAIAEDLASRSKAGIAGVVSA
ncbi:MAG: toxin-activating lysine-acyltransferase [Alphaproteobacteria bacterium]